MATPSTMSDEEAAAVTAALVLVFGGADGAAPPRPDVPTRWRFSGRWWSKPLPARRDRP